jgi:hypothetical protein
VLHILPHLLSMLRQLRPLHLLLALRKMTTYLTSVVTKLKSPK